MASAKRFGLYPCSFVHGGGTLNLQQMMGFGIEVGAQKKEFVPAGAVDPAAHLISHADPEASFQTADLATLLGTASLTAGLNCTSGATFRLQERTAQGTFETGSTHETITSTAGFLYLDSLDASIDDENGAMASCRYCPLWDASTRPFVHNTGVDFSGAPSPAFTSQFFLGPLYLNGSELEGVQRVSIKTGLVYSKKRTAGDPYARLGAIVLRKAIVQFTGLKIDIGGGVSMFGRALGGTFAVYLRKGVNNDTRVADASGAHIKISFATGDAQTDSVSAQENEDGTITSTVRAQTTLSLSLTSAIGG